MIKIIDVFETKVKVKSFGKTKVREHKVKKDAKCLDSCISPLCNTCKSQKDKDEELVDRRTKQIEEAVLKIKESRQGRAGNIFQMKKKIAGSKKSKQEAIAIRHPETGEIIVNKNVIKKVTLQYCVKNLKKNNPVDAVKEQVNKVRETQLEIMKDKTGESFEATWDEFTQVVDKFKKKDTKNI